MFQVLISTNWHNVSFPFLHKISFNLFTQWSSNVFYKHCTNRQAYCFQQTHVTITVTYHSILLSTYTGSPKHNPLVPTPAWANLVHMTCRFISACVASRYLHAQAFLLDLVMTIVPMGASEDPGGAYPSAIVMLIAHSSWLIANS